MLKCAHDDRMPVSKKIQKNLQMAAVLNLQHGTRTKSFVLASNFPAHQVSDIIKVCLVCLFLSVLCVFKISFGITTENSVIGLFDVENQRIWPLSAGKR